MMRSGRPLQCSCPSSLSGCRGTSAHTGVVYLEGGGDRGEGRVLVDSAEFVNVARAYI
jgi:hypothetical protein